MQAQIKFELKFRISQESAFNSAVCRMLFKTHRVSGKTLIASYSSAPSSRPVSVHGLYLRHQSSRRHREHSRHPGERPCIGIQCGARQGAAAGWCQPGSQSGKPTTSVSRWASWTYSVLENIPSLHQMMPHLMTRIQRVIWLHSGKMACHQMSLNIITFINIGIRKTEQKK